MSLPQPFTRWRVRLQRPGWIVAAVVVGALIFMLLLLALWTAVLAPFNQPREFAGFSIGHGQCAVDPTTGSALVQLQMQPKKGGSNSFKVETLANDRLDLLHVATLPREESLATLGPSEKAVERAEVHPLDKPTGRDSWGYLPHFPTNVVFVLHRDANASTATLPTITYWWGQGEVAFVQTVKLDLVWTATGCTVATR